MNMHKMLIIGIDGLDPFLVKKWYNELPTLSSLIEKGIHGVLKSCMPPLSCPAWICFSTGKQPGKLGFTDFFIVLDKKQKRVKPINSQLIPSESFWEILDRHGVRCCILNMPLTYPPKKLKNGIIVSGFPSLVVYREKEGEEFVFTYPPELSEELNKLFPGEGYEIDISDNIGFTLWSYDKIFKKIIKLIKKRTKVFDYVLSRYDWDLGIVVYTEIDRASHFFYGTAYLKEIYKFLDRELALLIAKYTDSTECVLILSDHGFTELKYEVYVNDFLKAKGYLKYNEPLLRKILSNVSTIIPEFLVHTLVELLPGSLRLKLPRERELTILDVEIDEDSKVYHVGDLYFQLYTITDDDALSKSLLRDIFKLKDPKGNPIVEGVYFKNDIFWGSKLDTLPDIIVKLKNGFKASMKIGQPNIIGKDAKLKGTHSEEGIHIWYGKFIKDGEIIHADIIDIAPTVFHIFDIPIPVDTDGKVLKDVFKENTPYALKEIGYESSIRYTIKEIVKKLKMRKGGFYG